jgi:hypothetical protein
MPQIQRGVLTSVLSPAGDGIRGAVRGIVRLGEGSVEAFVKILDAREVLVECVCALLGRARGLNVPEPLVVLVPGAYLSDGADKVGFGSVAVAHGSLRPWMANVGDAAVLRRLRAWAGLVPAACFDEWIANPDRHAGNILFDGKDEFWLIDHGLAIAAGVSSDRAVVNTLFAVAVDGLGEADKLLLKSKALGVVDAMVEQPVGSTLDDLPRDVLIGTIIGDVTAWLDARKTHLMRLTCARISTRQGDLLLGDGDGA